MHRPARAVATALLAGVLAIAAAGCGDAVVDAGPDPTASGRGTQALPSAAPGSLDPLDVALVLASDRVHRGESVGSRLAIENRSGAPVVDPGCAFVGTRFGLIAADDPDALPWQQIVVDCSGPVTMRPGVRDEYAGPSFVARTREGDALAPGAYLAVMKVDGRSARLEQPVTVD